MGIATCRRADRISPALGVIPPDDKSLQSSMRCAPPRSAATARSTDSKQISRTRRLGMGSKKQKNGKHPQRTANVLLRSASILPLGDEPVEDRSPEDHLVRPTLWILR